MQILQYLINGISIGSVYAIIALGYTMVYGIAKMLNFAHGDVIMVGAYICFFAVASFFAKDLPPALVSAMVIGGCVGFLVYNLYPARVFMGDTGSLFLGGMVVGSAFLMNNPLLVLVFGLVFVIETFSVMLQVGVYKMTKKRIFKMAPIHHHFEKCGWSEIKIVCIFSALTALFCAIAWLGVKF
jgi:phospho-N-acetylmuramoyl-pentapeptide-transferase